jgi:nicotinamide-nucleotide amidase
LLARGAFLAAAESCTGGLIAKLCTDLPGSSRWFDRGLVTYSNEAKRDLLGVREVTLRRHGAVSEAVAREMVRGVLRRSRATVAVAVTGIAGPDGGSAEKPVGTVWFAWARRQGRSVVVHAERKRFRGDRETVRHRAAQHALAGVLRQLGA